MESFFVDEVGENGSPESLSILDNSQESERKEWYGIHIHDLSNEKHHRTIRQVEIEAARYVLEDVLRAEVDEEASWDKVEAYAW